MPEYPVWPSLVFQCTQLVFEQSLAPQTFRRESEILSYIVPGSRVVNVPWLLIYYCNIFYLIIWVKIVSIISIINKNPTSLLSMDTVLHKKGDLFKNYYIISIYISLDHIHSFFSHFLHVFCNVDFVFLLHFLVQGIDCYVGPCSSNPSTK